MSELETQIAAAAAAGLSLKLSADDCIELIKLLDKSVEDDDLIYQKGYRTAQSNMRKSLGFKE